MNVQKAEQAGLVLAAGASSRMGFPKPLLRLPDGRLLGCAQAALLRRAGCDPVSMVLGAEEEKVRGALGDCAQFVRNERWRQGRVSSVQAGVRAVQSFAVEGCVLLPVDTAGVQEGTVRRMLQAVEKGILSVRPFYRGRRGLLCWISAALFERIAALDDVAESRARLDDLLQPLETGLEVEDSAILNNFNTPEAWEAWCGERTS